MTTATAADNLEELLAALPTAAYSCKPDGRLLFYNEHAAELWGRRPKLDDASDRFCGSHALLSPAGKPVLHDASWMARALQDGKAYGDKEMIVVRPDGGLRTVLAYVTPLHGAGGQLVAATAMLVDITERNDSHRAAEAALLASAANFRAFFDSNVVGFVQVNTAGRFVRVNDRYCELTGYSRAELLKMTPFDLDHPDDREADLERVKKAVADPAGVYEMVKRYVRKDGTVGWIHAAANMLRDELGRPMQSAGVALDVSEQKRAEQTLLDADRAKDEFLATLAHELRNPLAPLRNAVELLRHPREEPAWCRRVIERQVQQLARLIDDLLDVSRIARDKLDLRKETLAVADVIRNALEASRPLLEDRNQELLVGRLPERTYVAGDLARLTQVLTNLLTNAAKFTNGPGKISVNVGREGGDVRISVADTGIGIAKDELARVFDKFYQGQRRGDGSMGGLGIGLALVRRLVELHDGSVEARSDGPGLGSEFIVRLPMAQAPRRRHSAAAARGSMDPASGAPKRILIVDDNTDNADSLARLLALLGHETAIEYDGSSTVERARIFLPEVVLVDLGMPGFDGFEVCRRLRADAALQRPRIVAVTGWGRDEDRERTAAAGFDAHFVKPLDLEALARLLDEPPVPHPP
jgi:two-component system CheB/CheR fusion protein